MPSGYLNTDARLLFLHEDKIIPRVMNTWLNLYDLIKALDISRMEINLNVFIL